MAQIVQNVLGIVPVVSATALFIGLHSWAFTL